MHLYNHLSDHHQSGSFNADGPLVAPLRNCLKFIVKFSFPQGILKYLYQDTKWNGIFRVTREQF